MKKVTDRECLLMTYVSAVFEKKKIYLRIKSLIFDGEKRCWIRFIINLDLFSHS